MAGDLGLHRRITEHLDREEAAVEELERRTSPMTSPTQTRHDDLIALLNEICDLLSERLPKPPTYTVDLMKCRGVATDPEPVDVTEEPHKVHDHGIDPTCRERVGSDGLLRGECVDTAPDVDPDEALAKVLADADPHDAFGWDRLNERGRIMYRFLARAARERIEWELSRERDSALARAKQAEADVERLTRERDELSNQLADAEPWESEAARVANDREEVLRDVERLTQERDDYARLAAARDGERVCAEKRAEFFTDRYEAMRADVDNERREANTDSFPSRAEAALCRVLDRDGARRQANGW